MENTKTVARNGGPWAMIMVVALIIAKCGFGVNIGWLWVFAPIWLPIVIVIVIILVMALVALVGVLVAAAIAALSNRRRYA